MQKNSASGNIMVVGSLAYDRIMDFPGRFGDHILPEKIHALNVSFFVQKLEERFGGTAGNIAYTLALLGEHPCIVSAAGKDFAPYEAWLLRHGVNIDFVKRNHIELTASAYIITDRARNQITGFHPGAMRNKNVRIGLSKRLAKPVSLAIISPGNPKDMLAAAEECGREKIPYIFDPGQQIPVLDPQALRGAMAGAMMVIGNDYEMALIAQKTNLSKLTLLKKRKTVITTFGEEGSEKATAEKTYRIPALRVKKAVDPTGAGDAYRAGLIAALAKRRSWEVAGRIAATVASFAVEHYGTQEHHISWETVRVRYKKYFPSPRVDF